jgi:propionyl-CoA carboxylase beta chain
MGGADVHGTTSGVVHFTCDSELECLQMIRDLVCFLPLNNLDDPPPRANVRPRRPPG